MTPTVPADSRGSVLNPRWVEELESELERARAQLAEMSAQLERSHAALDRYASIVSHDLQEPVRTIGGFTNLFLRRYQGQLDATAEGWLGHIAEGTDRLAAMIGGLRQWSRLQTSGGTTVPVNLGELVPSVVEDLATQIRESGAQIAIAEPLPTVPGDPVQLRMLIGQLLSNAIKFHAPGVAPVVHLEAREDAGVAHVAVRDDGIGIDPKYRERVFEIFQQLQPRGAYAGHGLGLALVERIVERHGGTVAIESDGPGTGTSVLVQLPLSPAAP